MAMPKGFKHSSETIERIRFVKLGKKRSEATQAKIRLGMLENRNALKERKKGQRKKRDYAIGLRRPLEFSLSMSNNLVAHDLGLRCSIANCGLQVHTFLFALKLRMPCIRWLQYCYRPYQPSSIKTANIATAVLVNCIIFLAD